MKHRLTYLLSVLLLLPGLRAADVTPPTAAPAPVPGFTFVKTVGAVSEYTLDANGLQVLLLKDSPDLDWAASVADLDRSWDSLRSAFQRATAGAREREIIRVALGDS